MTTTTTLEQSLETERLVLEPIAAYHADHLIAGLADPQLYKYIPQEPPANQEALGERFTKLSKRASPDGLQLWLNWAVRLKPDKQYIGLMQATVNNDLSSTIAYFIFANWQHSGFCQESLERIIMFLWDDLKVQSIAAEIDTRNEKSIKVVESLGFARVSQKLDADYFKGSTSHEFKYQLHCANIST